MSYGNLLIVLKPEVNSKIGDGRPKLFLVNFPLPRKILQDLNFICQDPLFWVISFAPLHSLPEGFQYSGLFVKVLYDLYETALLAIASPSL